MLLLDTPETFWTLMHDAAHWEFELFVGFCEMIVFDLIFGVILWGWLLKPYLARKKQETIDEEHKLHNIEEVH